MCKLRAENQYDALMGLFGIAGLFTVARGYESCSTSGPVL